MRKTVCEMMLALLLMGILTLMFKVEPVNASGTIYIKADGSVDPPTAPILNVENDYYKFTADLNDPIVIQRDNIMVDGAGYTVQGTESGTGIDLSNRKNVTVKNTRIARFMCGIHLSNSLNNSLIGNNITDNQIGIGFLSSYNNSICGNTVTANNFQGIDLGSSSSNRISKNNITNNKHGIIFNRSTNNTLSGNNITNKEADIWLVHSSNNVFRNNSMANSLLNFYIHGTTLSDFVNDVDASNMVDGKPVYYWINKRNVVVPLDAGCVVLVNCTGITVKNLNLTKNDPCVLLAYTTNTTITKNHIANVVKNGNGISLYSSTHNSITGNNITNNKMVICLRNSYNNSIIGNNITNNRYGIAVYQSYNNSIFYNNCVDNVEETHILNSSPLDDGYPSGGNYWSNYNGKDFYSGPYQNETGSDGIGDQALILYENGIDRFPLMAPVYAFDVGTWNGSAYNVYVASNSIVSNFQLDAAQKMISFNVTGFGFCRITIPNVIVQDFWHCNYTILRNGQPWPHRGWADAKNTYIYFSYAHGEHEVTIITEFPPSMILSLLIALTILAVAFRKEKVQS